MTTFFTKIASAVTALALIATVIPMSVLAAPGDTIAPVAPSAVFPADGQTLPSADLTTLQWSDVPDAVSYTYQVSLVDSADGEFATPLYTQANIPVSELATGPNNPDGVYYWHLKTKDDEGLESSWSETFMFTLAPATTANVDSEAELAAALNDTNITTITLADSFSVNATVEVDRAVTIDGNSKTITAAPGVTGSAVLITGSGAVRISNLTVNGGANYIQGIQAYVASDVELNSVTSMNNGKSGIMVNGSTVSVSDVTTSGNTWHGINVDQGSGVTSAAVLTVKGTSTHSEAGPDIYIDTDSKGSVTGATAQYALVKPTPTSSAYFINSATVSNEAELTAALADQYVATITLDDSFEVSATVAVNRSVTIDGSDETITAGGAISHVVLITASDVLIKDLTVDGDNNMVHGIQAYTVTGITLDGVTSVNNGKSGILVNGSTVIVSNVTTSGNGWHAINVDQGSGVTSAAALTVSGTSAHEETVPAIWVDDNSKNVSVTDTDSQYTATAVTYLKSSVSVTGTQYFLTPEPVVVEEDNNSGSGRSGSSRRVTTTAPVGQVLGASTGPTDGQVLGASTYNFTVDLSYGSTGADVNGLQQMLIDAGLLAIDAPTGWFGPMTRTALAKWQAAHGVAPAVGYFGPITRAAIAAMNASTTPTTAE